MITELKVGQYYYIRQDTPHGAYKRYIKMLSVNKKHSAGESIVGKAVTVAHSERKSYGKQPAQISGHVHKAITGNNIVIMPKKLLHLVKRSNAKQFNSALKKVIQ